MMIVAPKKRATALMTLSAWTPVKRICWNVTRAATEAAARPGGAHGPDRGAQRAREGAPRAHQIDAPRADREEPRLPGALRGAGIEAERWAHGGGG